MARHKSKKPRRSGPSRRREADERLLKAVLGDPIPSPHEELENLKRLPSAQQRGRRLEKLLVRIFTEYGLEALLNPNAAAPRQTDASVHWEDKDYLVEAKWQKKRVGTGTVDSMIRRIQRAVPGFGGMIFSMSGFTGNAVADIEQRREQEIMLFRGDEIEALASRKVSPQDLMRRKKQELREHGKVWFARDPRTFLLKTYPFPPQDERVELANEGVVGSVCYRSSEELAFSRFRPDIPWAEFGGNGVGLHVPVTLGDLEQLRGLLGFVHSLLGLAGEGSFCIQQIHQMSWFGVGVDGFVEQIARWSSRYEEAGLVRPHHSEELLYVDGIRQGLFALSLRQRVGDYQFLHSAEITVRLAGLPVNTAPLVELCEAAGDTLAVLGEEKWPSFWQTRFAEQVSLDVIGRVLAYDGAGVSGLVTRNPFYRKVDICKSWSEERSPLHQIADMELLVCELSDKHTVEDVANSYLLTRIEAGKIGRVPVVRPVATWDRLA